MGHPIPTEALDSDIAIIARKGSGKSYLARGLAERLLDLKRRLVVIDPLGAWWGLRASADGLNAGYPVAVFGGDHADMPLSPSMGEPLAKLIATENFPCVIDTSLMRKEEQGQLAIDLFESLFRFNKDALTIILEEADVFAPQNPAKDGYAARVLHEIDRIARRGRARGLRLISLTQRPARLHKDVLSQAAALVAMRLSAPQDRDAIKAWVEGNADRDQAREVIDSLATLPVGSGWVWAPDLDLLEKVQFPKIKTLDTSATPKAGERRVEPKTLAQVDISAIREALAVTNSTIQDGQKSNASTARALSEAEERGYQRGLAEGTERGKVQGEAIGIAKAQNALSALRVGSTEHEISSTSAPPDMPAKPEVSASRRTSSAPSAEISSTTAIPLEAPGPGSAAVDMLSTLVKCHPLPITAQHWGAFSGRSPISGPWHKAVRELETADLISRIEGKFVTTEKGVAASTAEPVPVNDEIALWSFWRERIAELLGSAALEMLGVLAKYPQSRLTAPQWSLLAGRSHISGPWHGAVKVLVKWECIEVENKTYRISAKGAQIALPVDGFNAEYDLHQIRLTRASSLAQRIHEVLPGERKELAKRLGLSPISGPWHAAIKELKKSTLAVEVDGILRPNTEEVS